MAQALLELPPGWRSWSVAKKKALRRKLAAERARARMTHWRQYARYKQLPPDDPRHGYEQIIDGKTIYACRCRETGDRLTDEDWLIWLLMSGRGFGKTWVGASWIVENAKRYPNSEWAVIAPTFSDCRRVCLEGSTGVIRALDRDTELESYRRNDLEVTLANGSKIFGFSADRPDRVRGSNLWGAWCDELASWRYDATWHEGLMPALRIGEKPRILVTTTPRGTALLRELAERSDGTVHITQGSTFENAANLSTVALTELERRYGGTRLGRQELEGELIGDVEGALWKRAWLEADRIRPDQLPDMRRIVVGWDPAGTSIHASDEHGIMVVGLGTDGHLYVLEDLSGRMTPGRAARTVIRAYYEHEADRVVGESNYGGDFIEETLRTLDENLSYRSVTASRGKQVRAEPVSSIYEQHRAHHVGAFPKLEDQLCTWTPMDKVSPDRLDALVWASTELTQNADWTQMYGTAYTCPACTKMSLLLPDRPHCPHCHTPIDPVIFAKAKAA